MKQIINRFDTGMITIDRAKFGDGFSVINHADTMSNPVKFRPNPSYARKNTSAEELYGFTNVTAGNDYLWASGKGMKNWLSPAWKKRIKITATSEQATGLMYIDLHAIPELQLRGNDNYDIRVTNMEGKKLYSHLLNPKGSDGHPSTRQTLVVKSNLQDIYLYYDNPDANMSNGQGYSVFSNFRRAWILNTDLSGKNDHVTDGTDNYIARVSYVPRYLLEGEHLATTETVVGGSQGALSAYFLWNEVSGGDNSNMSITFGGGFGIELSMGSNGRVFAQAYFKDNGHQEVYSNSAYSGYGNQLFIYVQYDKSDGKLRLWINGVEQTTYPQNNVYANYSGLEWGSYRSRLNSDYNYSGGGMALVMYHYSRNLGVDSVHLAMSQMLGTASGDAYTFSPARTINDVALLFEGFALWKRPIEGDHPWVIHETSQNGLVSFPDRYPAEGFIRYNGNHIHTLIAREETGDSFWDLLDVTNDYKHIATPTTVYNSQIFRYRPSALVATFDGETYFTMSSIIRKASDPTNNYYSAYVNITALVNTPQNMLIAGYRYNKSWIEWFNYVNAVKLNIANFGDGEIGGAGQVGQRIVAIKNVFIDNKLKAANMPRLEMRVLSGSETSEEFYGKLLPTDTEGDTDISWDRPVRNAIPLQNGVMTYVRIPVKKDKSEMLEGMWLVSSDSNGRLAVSIPYDLRGMGLIRDVDHYGNQIVILHDHKVSMLDIDETFNIPSYFETLIIDGGDNTRDKRLISLRIPHEPLKLGQTITVEYRKNEEEDWLPLASRGEEGDIETLVTRNEITNQPLPYFDRIQFKISTVGGGSAILAGVSVEWEWLEIKE